MKRVIRLLPILFALPLLGLFPNSQRIEKAEAVNTTDRYFITDEADTYGLIKSGNYGSDKLTCDTLSNPSFVFVDIGDGKYRVYDCLQTPQRYLCHETGNDLVKFYETSKAEQYNYCTDWELSVENSHTYLKSTNNRYLAFSGVLWYASQTKNADSQLAIFSIEENSAPFVTAMHNIACTDLVNGPDKTGDNSWASASTAFSGLKQPTKNYLTTLAADMTYGDINTPERAVGKYDYIVNKYNKGGVVYTEFITGRSTSGLVNIDSSTLHSNSVTNTPIIIVISFITVLSFTSILILRKKR